MRLHISARARPAGRQAAVHRIVPCWCDLLLICSTASLTDNGLGASHGQDCTAAHQGRGLPCCTVSNGCGFAGRCSCRPSGAVVMPCRDLCLAPTCRLATVVMLVRRMRSCRGCRGDLSPGVWPRSPLPGWVGARLPGAVHLRVLWPHGQLKTEVMSSGTDLRLLCAGNFHRTVHREIG